METPNSTLQKLVDNWDAEAKALKEKAFEHGLETNEGGQYLRWSSGFMTCAEQLQEVINDYTD